MQGQDSSKYLRKKSTMKKKNETRDKAKSRSAMISLSGGVDLGGHMALSLGLLEMGNKCWPWQ